MANKIKYEVLKTVALAAAKKPSVPILSHFCFYNGRVQCSDSVVTIDAEFDITIETVAPIKQFMAAVAGTEGARFSLKRRLSIKTGYMHSTFGVLNVGDFPLSEALKNKKKIKAGILPSMKRLEKFIDSNAYRTWSTGVLVKDGFGYATDNVILVRDKLFETTPDIVLPRRLVSLLIKINMEPTHFSTDDNAICFWFEDMWLKSTLLDNNWPDAERIIDSAKRSNVFSLLSMHDGLLNIKKFDTTKGTAVITFDGKNMAMKDETSDVDVACDVDHSTFNLDALIKVTDNADLIHINWPEPCYFECVDESLDGVLVGVNK